MRATSLVAGLAIVVAACGGEKKAPDQAATTTSDTSGQQQAPAAAPAAAPAGTGATHDVSMELQGSTYKFDPAELTIKKGDVVQFHNKTGGPHNVSFWSDSIPKGAADKLSAGMPDQMSPLQGPLLAEPDKIYKVSFAADIPVGVYKFYCLPHLALGMHGKITVQ
jgi:plastocyanin